MNRGLNPELGLAILRVVLGVIFIAHGSPNLFGGMEDLAGSFAQLGIPLPPVAAWLIVLLEVVGGLLLIVGFLVTPIAALLATHMLVGIVLVHARNGFYVIQHGQGGIEFNLLLIVTLLMLILGGPGLAALDNRRGAGGVAEI
jgi:putative oxidoreductase